ncbi:protein FRA10AC1 [Salvelinus fontinalis]|uniref:Protein FRA10AC1-like isoform X1 n=1 Tax=Salvelinus namaycush TaxID=8040 RepID=A0A8U0PU00_SALNM|nr:protein FRA10AC1-like isoform X1 [Salvelinus namaycush]XP_055746695.1 protein FRA10AC1 [Salvelinus fontinalis]
MARNMDSLVKVHGGGGYDSDFSDDEGQGETSQRGVKRKREEDLLRKPFQKARHTKVAHRDVATHEYDREEARNRRHHLISMNAFERHKKFVSDYILYYGGKVEDLRRSTANDKSDLDVVRENHRFLWRDEDEEEMTWEKELAKKYYDKLFKEYCIADLSRYKENKFGFRWRVEKEVVSGKGQFLCGNKRCEKEDGLKSWEVNFAYVEQGEKRNALVKLRLCPECSFKLNYHHKRKEVIAKRKRPKSSEENEVEPQSKRSKKGSKKHKNKHKKRQKDHSSPSNSEDDSQESDKAEGEHSEEPESLSEADHWKGPAPTMEEKSSEEKFDEYFEDMFL